MDADKIARGVAEPPVRTENGLCSRYRCSKSQCTACADVCPAAGALRLTEQGVEINDACVACGACVSACPNGAIQSAQTDRALAVRIRALVEPEKPFRVACESADGPADMVVACLSRLTEALLLEPLRWGTERVEILDPGCKGCPLEKASPQWERVFQLAGSLCEAAGLDRDRIIRVPVPRRDPKVAPSAPEEAVSRRDLFCSFARKTAKVAATALPDMQPQRAPAELFRDALQRHHENPKRSHLLEVLQSLSSAGARSKKIPVEGRPFADLEVTSKCMGCNVCETLCPVGAIGRREENGVFALEFDPACCTGCRVCEMACLPKAIRVKESFDLHALMDCRVTTLIRSNRRTCQACRADFLDDASDFCPLCLLTERRQKAMARRWILGGNGNGRA